MDALTGLYTPQQAADYLGFTVAALAAWRSRGGGPRFVKINGRVCRYRKEDLDAWIAERLRNSTSDPGPEGGR